MRSRVMNYYALSRGQTIGYFGRRAGSSSKKGIVGAKNLQVVFIRHGEKPSDESKCGLSPDGWKRAFKIRDNFLSSGTFLCNTKPADVRLYAMKQKVDDDMTGHSIRPIETILPLADELGKAIDSSFKKDKQKDCVEDIISNCANKTVIVCWEHKALFDFYEKFGLAVPPKLIDLFQWSSQDFSKIVVFNFDSDSSLKTIDIRDQDNTQFLRTLTPKDWN
jgi:hypothetical protein